MDSDKAKAFEEFFESIYKKYNQDLKDSMRISFDYGYNVGLRHAVEIIMKTPQYHE